MLIKVPTHRRFLCTRGHRHDTANACFELRRASSLEINQGHAGRDSRSSGCVPQPSDTSDHPARALHARTIILWAQQLHRIYRRRRSGDPVRDPWGRPDTGADSRPHRRGLRGTSDDDRRSEHVRAGDRHAAGDSCALRRLSARGD
jgi:hypothetical protein